MHVCIYLVARSYGDELLGRLWGGRLGEGYLRYLTVAKGPKIGDDGLNTGRCLNFETAEYRYTNI